MQKRGLAHSWLGGQRNEAKPRIDPKEQPFERISMRLGKEKEVRVRRDAEGLVAEIEVGQKQVFIRPRQPASGYRQSCSKDSPYSPF